MRTRHDKISENVQSMNAVATCVVLMWSHSFSLAATFFVAMQLGTVAAVRLYRFRTKLIQQAQAVDHISVESN